MLYDMGGVPYSILTLTTKVGKGSGEGVPHHWESIERKAGQIDRLSINTHTASVALFKAMGLSISGRCHATEAPTAKRSPECFFALCEKASSLLFFFFNFLKEINIFYKL